VQERLPAAAPAGPPDGQQVTDIGTVLGLAARAAIADVIATE
jgi:hypothetical protein